jgi:ABC-type sugar transport system ATPase subunit
VDDTPLLELCEGSKSFGATRALQDVSFSVLAGEVHVLAGENGAGKSTLIRILSGAHTDFAGTLKVDGRAARFRGPEDAARAGIATIHQELCLVGPMSVADNLLSGIDRGSTFGLLDHRRRQRKARRILAAADLPLEPNLPVEALPLSERQLLEIARALGGDARVIVMDEPTSALSEREAARLFDRIDELRKQGKGIVYISHRMEEIYRVADRITVLRDGRLIRTARTAELGREELVRSIAGRDIDRPRRPESALSSHIALTVRDLQLSDPERPDRRILDGISLEVRAGEVLGIAGLRGSGSSELLHAIFGSYGPLPGARIELGGATAPLEGPAAAIEHGVILLAADRHSSIAGDMSVAHNTSLSSLKQLSRLGWIDGSRELAAVAAMIAKLGIVASSPRAPAATLSGGNQQKVALSRCLLTQPKVLLLDEPTRGIDVGAKAEIYQLIADLTDEGLAVLLVASEMEELIELSHRVLVLHQGRSAAVLAGEELTRTRILAAAMGGTSEAA